MIITKIRDKKAFCDSYWTKVFLIAKSTSRFAKELSSAIWIVERHPFTD